MHFTIIQAGISSHSEGHKSHDWLEISAIILDSLDYNAKSLMQSDCFAFCAGTACQWRGDSIQESVRSPDAVILCKLLPQFFVYYCRLYSQNPSTLWAIAMNEWNDLKAFFALCLWDKLILPYYYKWTVLYLIQVWGWNGPKSLTSIQLLYTDISGLSLEAVKVEWACPGQWRSCLGSAKDCAM